MATWYGLTNTYKHSRKAYACTLGRGLPLNHRGVNGLQINWRPGEEANALTRRFRVFHGYRLLMRDDVNTNKGAY